MCWHDGRGEELPVKTSNSVQEFNNFNYLSILSSRDRDFLLSSAGTQVQMALLEQQMDEEAKGLPKSEYHAGHQHELTLVSEGNGGGAYICCDCEEQGLGWAYQCMECGYEVHPKCIKPVVAIDSLG